MATIEELSRQLGLSVDELATRLGLNGNPALQNRAWGEGGRGNPNAAWLQAMQDQRRYGGSPVFPTYESFINNAMIAQYGPRLGAAMARGQLQPMAQGRYPSAFGPTRNSSPTPLSWSDLPMWQYAQGGAGPYAGIPEDQRMEVDAQLQAALPWAQMSRADREAALDRALAQRQQDIAAQQWQQQFGAGRQDQVFQNWLATQQLGLQQGQAGQDNAWRQRQLDMQQALQNFQMGPQWQQQVGQQNWENQYRDRDWNAGQAQLGIDNAFRQQQADLSNDQWNQQFGLNQQGQLWDQGFQQQQADIAANQWNQQFGANRDDALWNRDWQNRNLTEDTRRFDLTNAQQQALNQWNQAFQQSQFDWTKQRAPEQDALQRELQAMSTFGRRFGPAIGAM